MNRLVGKTIKSIAENPDADEGLLLVFDDGMIFEFGYSGDEGSMSIDGRMLSVTDIYWIIKEE